MGGAPYDAPVAHQEYLRGVMSDTQSRCDRVRHVSVRLHCDHRVRRRGAFGPAVEMFDELVERFRARAACVTVFEEEQRTALRLGNQTIELVDLCQCRQVRMRAGTSSQRETSSSRRVCRRPESPLGTRPQGSRLSRPCGTRLRHRLCTAPASSARSRRGLQR